MEKFDEITKLSKKFWKNPDNPKVVEKLDIIILKTIN